MSARGRRASSVHDEVVIGIAQWLPATARANENLVDALAFVNELARAGCDLIVLPELWPCGFDWESLAADVATAAEPLNGPRRHALGAAARDASAWLCAGTVPERADGAIYNTLLLFDRSGELRATHRKTHLYEPLGEGKAVTPGDGLTTVWTDEFGEIGLSICFDGDFPEVARGMALRGARVVLHPAAYEHAAKDWWDTLYRANALANGQWWVMANQCGTNRSGTLFGASQIVSPFGCVVAQAGQADAGQTPPPEMLVASLDLRGELERADSDHAVLRTLRRPELYGEMPDEIDRPSDDWRAVR
jgi:predicted amidohydrolase